MKIPHNVIAVAAALLLSSATAWADVSISSKPTRNMSCSVGVCTATAGKAVLNVGDLQTMLASGDATVKTGSIANDIDIDQPLAWTSTSRLTLDARQSVVVRKAVVVAGTGALTIVTNDGGKNGDFFVMPPGNVVFWDVSSDLNINGQQYQLLLTLPDVIHAIKKSQKYERAAYLALAGSISSAGSYRAAPIAAFDYGVFEGLGNAIAGLNISNSGAAYTGLIAMLGAEVHNLNVTSVTVTGTNDRAGGIAGLNAGTIANSSVSGSVSAQYAAGGLVGENYGAIVFSSASGHISGEFAGGLVGSNKGGGRISFAHSDATVSSDYLAGGLVGANTDQYTCADTVIMRSYATGSANGSSYAGGLAGLNQAAQIVDSYSTGAVNTSSSAGGLVGWDLDDSLCAGKVPEIGSSYSTGTVGGSILGGFIGSDVSDSALSSTNWDLDTSGISDPHQGAGNVSDDPGITGLSDSQLKSGLPDGFDPKIWGQAPNVNNGYPYLLANPPPK